MSQEAPVPDILTEDRISAFERDGHISPLDGISPEEAHDCVARIEAFEDETGDDVSRVIRVRACLALNWEGG